MSRYLRALRQIEEQSPQLLRLVRALSLAVRCESELVRAMRLRLMPLSDPGLEADLWFSPLVQAADVSAVVLAQEVRAALQPELSVHPEELENAWQVIQKVHAKLDAVVLLEESHTYHALRAQHLAVDSPEARAAEEQAARELGSVLKALRADPNDRNLLRWIARFLPRLPAKTAGSAAAMLLKREAQKHLPSLDAPSIPMVDPQRFFAESDRIELWVRRVERGVWLSRRARRDAHRIEAPATTPVRLEVAWPTPAGWDTRFAVLDESTPPQLVATPVGQVRLRTQDGREWRLLPEGERPLVRVYRAGVGEEALSAIRETIKDLDWRWDEIGTTPSSGKQGRRRVFLSYEPPATWPVRDLRLALDRAGFQALDILGLGEESSEESWDRTFKSMVDEAQAMILLVGLHLPERSIRGLIERVLSSEVPLIPVEAKPGAVSGLGRDRLGEKLLERQFVRFGEPDEQIAQIVRACESIRDRRQEGKQDASLPDGEPATASLLVVAGLDRLREMGELFAHREDAKGPAFPMKFQIYRGDQLVREETLNEPVIKIGKMASSHLRLEDETVSRMHAVVEVTGPGELQLIDLGSARGTMVNGERINKAVLKSGDQIHFGDTRVVVVFAAKAVDSVATPAPVVQAAREGIGKEPTVIHLVEPPRTARLRTSARERVGELQRLAEAWSAPEAAESTSVRGELIAIERQRDQAAIDDYLASRLGGHLTATGATFRFWAPAAKDVFVMWGKQLLPKIPRRPADEFRLTRQGEDFVGFIAGAKDGDKYRYWVVGPNGEGPKRDPHARELALRPLEAHSTEYDCVLRDADSYPWSSDGYRAPQLQQLVLYQLHVGTFFAGDDDGKDARLSRVGRFLDVVDHFEHLVELGITGLQLLPVAAKFQERRSMGYDPTDYFALETGYVVPPEELGRYVDYVNRLRAKKGAPALPAAVLEPGVNQLKALVDLCHLHGIAVLVSFVYSHAGGGFDEQSMDCVDFERSEAKPHGSYFQKAEWAGGAVFDYGRAPVRRFLVDNARAMVAEYRLDGLQCDEATVIENHGGWAFCQELTSSLRGADPTTIKLAEYWKPDKSRAVQDVSRGGAGFDAVWDDALLYAVRQAIAGAAGGPDAGVNLDAIRDALLASSRLTDAAHRWCVVHFLENHDVSQASRSDPFPRLARLADPTSPHSWLSRSRSRVANAILLTGPGIPMVFMGQEILEDRLWSDNPVHYGETLVQWDRLQEQPAMAAHLRFMRELLKLRREQPALTTGETVPIQAHNRDRVLAMLRRTEDGAKDVVVIVSLNESRLADYEIGFPQTGAWQLLFNGDDYEIDPERKARRPQTVIEAIASGKESMPASARVTIPPNGVLVFGRATSAAKPARPPRLEGLGAMPHPGGAAFRVWAPNAREVSVAGDFNDWNAEAAPLEREPDGCWFTDVAGAAPGQYYKYTVVQRDGQRLWRVDPRARSLDAERGGQIAVVPGLSRTELRAPEPSELVLYQVHVGSFAGRGADRVGTFTDVVEKLDYLQELGINAIQLLPVFECSAANSLGYDPAQLFAVRRSYGGREGLQALVRAAHARGVAVFVDLVLTHLAPNANLLWRFDGGESGGIYFYDDWRASSPWGPRLNYGRPEVRKYIRDSVFLWFDEYDVDGARWSATNEISRASFDGPAIPEGDAMLREIVSEVRERFPDKLMIAEDSRQAPSLLGTAGFGAVWDFAFARTLREAMTSPDDNQRSLAAIAAALMGTAAELRPVPQRVSYTESFDMTVSQGRRLPSLIQPDTPGGWFARRRSMLAAGLMLTAPGIPMLVQGQEWLSAAGADAPLDWDGLEKQSACVRFCRELIALRRERPCLRSPYIDVFHRNETDKVMAFCRSVLPDPATGDVIVVVANLAHRPYSHYSIGVPRAGAWHVVFSSDASMDEADDFTQQGVVAAIPESRDGRPFSVDLKLRSYGILLLAPAAESNDRR